AWLEAMRLLATPFILVLWIVTFVDSTVHNLFFNWTGTFLGTPVVAGGVGIPGNWIMPVMSLGQIAEILTMLVLGVTLKKLGWPTTMIVGILGHAARFAVFAFLPQQTGLVVTINLIHGIAYAFFFATVYIFVDEFFPTDVRSSAQGLFNLMILGLGPLVANILGPKFIGETFRHGAVVDFRSMFLVPLMAAIVAAGAACPARRRSSAHLRRRLSRATIARCPGRAGRRQDAFVGRSERPALRRSPSPSFPGNALLRYVSAGRRARAATAFASAVGCTG